jgi:hypothetical protein
MMKLWALYSRKRRCIMGFSTRAVEGEDGGFPETTTSLEEWFPGNPLWVSPSKDEAEKAASTKKEEVWLGDFTGPIFDREYYGDLDVIYLDQWLIRADGKAYWGNDDELR